MIRAPSDAADPELLSGVHQLEQLFALSEKSLRSEIRRVATGTRDARHRMSLTRSETQLMRLATCTSVHVNARAVRLLVFSQRQAALALQRLFVQQFWPAALRRLRAPPTTAVVASSTAAMTTKRKDEFFDDDDDDVDRDRDDDDDFERDRDDRDNGASRHHQQQHLVLSTNTVAVPARSAELICLQTVFGMLQALFNTCRVLDPSFEVTLYRLLGDAVSSLRCSSLASALIGTNARWHIGDYHSPLAIGLGLCIDLVSDRHSAPRADAIHVMLGLALASGHIETVLDVCDRLVTCDQSASTVACEPLLGELASCVAVELTVWTRTGVLPTPHPTGGAVAPMAVATFVLEQLALLADQLVADPLPVRNFESTMGKANTDAAVRMAVSLSDASFGSLLRLVERVVDAEHLRRVVEATQAPAGDAPLGDELAPPRGGASSDQYVPMRVSLLQSAIRLMRLHVALLAVPRRPRLAPPHMAALRGVARGVFERRVLPRGVSSDDDARCGQLSMCAALLLASAAPLLYETPAARSRLLQSLLTGGSGDDAHAILIERLMEQFADPLQLATLVESELDVGVLASRITSMMVARTYKLLDDAVALALERDKVADATAAATSGDNAPSTSSSAAAAAEQPLVVLSGERHMTTYGGAALTMYDSGGLVDICGECKWSASSTLASRRAACVADGSAVSFWQSNGSSTHHLRARFKSPAQVAVVSLMNDDDRSFTPRTIDVALLDAAGETIAEQKRVHVRQNAAGWFDVKFDAKLRAASSLRLSFVNQRSGGVDVRVHRCAVFAYPFIVPAAATAVAGGAAAPVDWGSAVEYAPSPAHQLLMSLLMCCAAKRAESTAPLLATVLAASADAVQHATGIVAAEPSNVTRLHAVLRALRSTFVGVVAPAPVLAYGDGLVAAAGDADGALVEPPLLQLARALEALLQPVRAATSTDAATAALGKGLVRCPADHACKMSAPNVGAYVDGWVCDDCGAEQPVETAHMHCEQCTFDLCDACEKKLNPPTREVAVWASISANQQFIAQLHEACFVAVAERARYAIDAIARADVAPQLMSRDVPTEEARTRAWLRRAPLANGAADGHAASEFDGAVAALSADVAALVDALPRAALLALDKPSAAAMLALVAAPFYWHGGTPASLATHAPALLRWFAMAKQQAIAGGENEVDDDGTPAPPAPPVAPRDVVADLRARALLLWSCERRGDATGDVLAFLRDSALRDAAEVSALWHEHRAAAVACGAGMTQLAALIADHVESKNVGALLTLCGIAGRRMPRFSDATARAVRAGLSSLTRALSVACAFGMHHKQWAVVYHTLQFFVRDLVTNDDFDIVGETVYAQVREMAAIDSFGDLVVTPERVPRVSSVDLEDVQSGAWLALAHIARSAARAPHSVTAAQLVSIQIADFQRELRSEPYGVAKCVEKVALLAALFESPAAWPALLDEDWELLVITLLRNGVAGVWALVPRVLAHKRNAAATLGECELVGLMLEAIGTGVAAAAQVSLQRFKRASLLSPSQLESPGRHEAAAADCVSALHCAAAVSDELRSAMSGVLSAAAARVGAIHAALAAPFEAPSMSPEQLLASVAASKKAMSSSDAQALCRGIGALTVLAGGGATFERLAAVPHTHLRLVQQHTFLSATCSPDKHNVMSHFNGSGASGRELPRSEAPWPVRLVVRFASVVNVGAVALECSTANCDSTYVSVQMPRICIWRRRVDDQRLELVRDERDVQLAATWAFVRATGNRDGAPWCARTDELTIELYMQSTHVQIDRVRVYETTYERELGDAPLCADLLRAADAAALVDALRPLVEAGDDAALAGVTVAAHELHLQWSNTAGTHKSARSSWARVLSRAQLCALTRSVAVRAVHAALRSPAAFAALRERLQPLLVAATRALPQLPGDTLVRVPLAQPIDVANDERSVLYLLTEVEGAAALDRAAAPPKSGAAAAAAANGSATHTESLDSSVARLLKTAPAVTRQHLTASTGVSLLVLYRWHLSAQEVLREYPLPAIVYDVLVDLCIDEQESRAVLKELSGDDLAMVSRYGDVDALELSAATAATAASDVCKAETTIARAVVVRSMANLIAGDAVPTKRRKSKKAAAADAETAAPSSHKKTKKKSKKSSSTKASDDGDEKRARNVVVGADEALPLWRWLLREFTSPDCTLAMLVTTPSKRERRKLLRDAAKRFGSVGGSEVAAAASPAPPRDNWHLWREDKLHWSGTVGVRLTDELDVDCVEPFHVPAMSPTQPTAPRRSGGFAWALDAPPLDSSQRMHEQRARLVRRAHRSHLIIERQLLRAEGQALDVNPDGADAYGRRLLQRRVDSPVAGWIFVRHLNGFASGDKEPGANLFTWSLIRDQHASPGVVPLAEVLALEAAKLRVALARHLLQRCALALLADWTSHGAPLPPLCSLSEPRSWRDGAASGGAAVAAAVAAAAATAPLSDAQQLRLLEDVFDVAHTAQRPFCFAASHDEPHVLHESDASCAYVADTLAPATPFARASLERLRVAFELQVAMHAVAALASGVGGGERGTAKRKSSAKLLALALPEQLYVGATRTLEAFRTSNVPMRAASAHKSVLRACWVLNLLLDAALPLLAEAAEADTVDALRRAVPFVARLFAAETLSAAVLALRQCTTMLTATPVIDIVGRLLQHQQFFKTAPDLEPLYGLWQVADERKHRENAVPIGDGKMTFSFELQSLVRMLLLLNTAFEHQVALADVRALGAAAAAAAADEKKPKPTTTTTKKKKSKSKSSAAPTVISTVPDGEQLLKRYKFCDVRARPAQPSRDSLVWFFELSSLLDSIAATRRTLDSEPLELFNADEATASGGGARHRSKLDVDALLGDDDPLYESEDFTGSEEFVDDDDIDSEDSGHSYDVDEEFDEELDDDSDESELSDASVDEDGEKSAIASTSTDDAAAAGVSGAKKSEADVAPAYLTREQEQQLMLIFSKHHSLSLKHVTRSSSLRRFRLSALQLQCAKLESLTSLVLVASAMVDFSARDDVQGPFECVLQNRHLVLGSVADSFLRRQPVQAYVSAIQLRLDRLRTRSDTRLAGDDGIGPRDAGAAAAAPAHRLDDATLGAPPAVVIGRAYAELPHKPKVRASVLEQAAAQLASIAPGFLARHDDSLFAAKFIGEAGADAGGVYREALSMICRDVMAGEGELCVPTPNALFNVGERRGDRLPVLRRAASLPLSERVLLFEFLGMLIGQAALRETHLDLDFPLLFWKQLVGDQPTLDDLAEYDAIAYESLRRLSETAEQAARALARPDAAAAGELDALCAQLAEAVDGLGDEALFVTTLSTGETATLRRGGELLRLGASSLAADAPVGERLRALVAAVRAFVAESVAVRCSESFGAARHVRRGMARMMSLAMARAFGGAHFARRVCGEATINLEELRRHTSSHSAGKATVDMLFAVLAKFSNADQRRFVQFVYGQSRLPSSFDNATFNVVRRSTSGEPDKSLPTAGTCDFSISLPRYSSADVMAERLLFAIRNCVAIDTDGSVTSMSDGSESTDAGAVGEARYGGDSDSSSTMSGSGSTTGEYSYEYESEEYVSSEV